MGDGADPTVWAVVVGHDPHRLARLCELTRQAGLEPRACPDAPAALQLLDPETPPALVVTELRLPGMDGWRLCRRLRTPAYAAFHHVPLVVVSLDDAGCEPETLADDLGVEAFLPAPLDAQVFLDTVQGVLGQGRRREAESPSQRLQVLEDILESTLAGYWDWNFRDGTAFYSPAFKRRLGYGDDEVPNTLDAWETVACPEDVPRDLEVLDRHIRSRGREPYCNEIRYRHKDGSTVWVICAGRVIEWAPDGSPVRMVGCHVDVTGRRQVVEALWEYKDHLEALVAERTTALQHSYEELKQEVAERKRAEEEARRAAAEWQATFDATNDAILVLDAEHRVLRSNKTAERLFRLTGHDMIGLPCRDIVSGRSERDGECPARRAWRSGRRERAVLARDGRWLEAVVDPIRDGGDRLTGLVFIVTDITDRRLAEEQLIQAKETYLEIFNTLTEAIYIQDESGAFLEINRGAETMYGRSRQELIGQYPSAVTAPGLNDLERVSRSIASTFQTGEPSRFEFWAVRSDGTVFPKDVIVNKGKYFGRDVVIATARDITERKRAEQEREALQAQLLHAHKMESVGRLAGGVAHDFNNMLGVILGHTELAMRRLDPADPLYLDLAEVYQAAESSAAVTRQLLGFARKQTVSPRVLDLNRTVTGMLGMLRRLIGEDIDLDWQPGADLWPVKIDPAQLDQILANLCANARGAIAGVGRIAIGTGNATFDAAYCEAHSGHSPGEWVYLAVGDNGCGMDQETMANIFDPFFTTKEAGMGTGLGLATVYGIVQQNRGFITVNSEPHRGSRFAVYLPRQSAPPESAGEKPPAGRPRLTGRATVLLVEDDPAILRMTRNMLELFGCTVLAAGNPVDACRQAESHPGGIDLLVTDVIMPEMNGRDLAHWLQQRQPGLRSLFMSGYSADVIASHGVLTPEVSFLPKPFTVEELQAAVCAVLGSGAGQAP